MSERPSFEAANGFHVGLAGGDFASVVGAAFGVVAQRDDGHDVQHSVDPAVARSGQSMALLFA
jgi:hypothetical protein